MEAKAERNEVEAGALDHEHSKTRLTRAVLFKTDTRYETMMQNCQPETNS